MQRHGRQQSSLARLLLVSGLLISLATGSLAEGSKDFFNYPGYRMFLDTRDPQQLKVYAAAGEFINVGASHVGLQGGYIRVYRPDGTLAATFDNTGNSTGLAIIDNNVEEQAGPTGGGTTNGNGYVPGIIQVAAGQDGVWTVVFDYPSYQNTSFLNILNNQPWTRGANQPNSRRVVLAWDVTVTSGAAGNDGGTVHEGRLYSNEHISLINGNGLSTSPIFYVLTDDGFLYQVDVHEADPFRFPISSNSFGIVKGNGTPTYKSKTETDYNRSDNPNSWNQNDNYLYEPQAEDFPALGLVNNKIFFNLPDNTMPGTATVTDIYRSNTHTTWLYSPVQLLEVGEVDVVGESPSGIPCAPGAFQFGYGGYFIFETNTGGNITLQLDIDNNGSFTDPVDVEIMGVLDEGFDSIYWNGKDGLNVSIPVQDSFELNYQGIIRFGELHIALFDVENSAGGVTFTWLNAPPATPSDLFYYDHSEIGGPVSGGGTPGNPLPTTIPYTYAGNAGNDQYIDQWFFKDYIIPNTKLYINIVDDCVCATATPELTTTGGGDICAGQDLVLTAQNSLTGIGDLTYAWSGPNNYSFSEVVGETAVSTATIADVSTQSTGAFQVIATTSGGCADTLQINVNVLPTPDAGAIAGGGEYCAGETVTLSATNTVPGIDTIFYTWDGPAVLPSQANGQVLGGDPITIQLTNVQVGGSGTYTLTMTSELGCVSDPITTSLQVNSTPVLAEVSGSGSYCVNDDVNLVATNSATGFTTMTCVWNGPNIFNVTQTIAAGSQATLPLNNVNNSFEGVYTLVCTVGNCDSEPLEFNVVVNEAPSISAISPNGDFCEGSSVTLTGQNGNPDTGPIIFTWSGPNPNNPLLPFTDTSASQVGPFELTIPNLGLDDEGTYTLQLETLGGCESVPLSVQIDVIPSPDIQITGGGDACAGQDVTLTAINTVAGFGTITYTWTGPNGSVLGSGVVSGNEPCELTIPSVTDSDEGWYTITKTVDATGCSTTDSVELNVFPGLNLINITPDSSYCEFTDVVLSAENTVDAGDLTFSWSGPCASATDTFTVGSTDPMVLILPSITPDCEGTYILNVTSTIGCEATASVNVDVLDGVQIVSVTPSGDYCADAIIELTGTGEGSADTVIYTWTDTSGVIIASDTTTAQGPFDGGVVTQSGTYILEVVAVPSGCSDSEQVDINFLALPEVEILGEDSLVLCGNEELVLCGQVTTPNTGPFTYVWTTANGTIIPGSETGNDPFCDTLTLAELGGSGWYELVVTVGNCTSEPDSVYVDVLPVPSISVLSGAGDYCQGDTAFICFVQTNPEVDSFYHTCNLPDGTQVTQFVTSDTFCVSLTTSGTICCSVESTQGCFSSLVCATVTFENSAELSAPAVDTVCANDTLQLVGFNSLPCSGNITYAWNGPCGFTFVGTAPCGGPFTASVPNPCPGVYCLIAPLNSSCPDTVCVTVVVNPVPQVVNNTISGGGTYCEGDDATLTATVTISDNSPITYQWCLNDQPIPGATGTVPSGSVVTLDLSGLGQSDEGEYCLKLTSVNGCQNDPPTCVNLNVNPSPTIATTTGGGTYCEGLDVQLNGTGLAGQGTVNYTWFGPCNFVFTGSAPSGGPFPATIPSISQDCGGLYCLVLDLNGCTSDTVCVVVDVNPKPIIEIISGGGTYCEGETVTVSFTVDPNGAASATWEFDSQSFDTSGTVTTLTTITFTVTATGTETFTITASSDEGCEADPQSISIQVQELDPITLTADPNPLCPGSPLTLTVTDLGQGATYDWFLNGVLLQTTSVPILVIDNPQPGEYSVTANLNGCSVVSPTFTVTAQTTPDAVDDNYTSNTPTPVTGNVLDNDQTGGSVTVTVVDEPTSGSVSINSDGTFTYTPEDPVETPVTFTYQICLTTCPDVCDEATVTITYVLDCEVPNVITPNGDGINDVLIIDCIPAYPNNSLKIFNRWGDEIQSYEPYNNDEGWDGTYGSDKKAVPAATYFYLLLLDKDGGNGDDNLKSGYIKVHR